MKRTVESSRFISVLEFARRGYFRNPQRISWVWLRDGKVTAIAVIEIGRKELEIRWLGSTQSAQQIGINWTRCRFGGQRPWFRCRCGKSVIRVYSSSSGLFACRSCCRLTYASRQARPRHRLWLRAQKVRIALGGSRNMLDKFPVRPRYMHHKRYDRLHQQHNEASQRALGMSAVQLSRLSGRLRR